MKQEVFINFTRYDLITGTAKLIQQGSDFNLYIEHSSVLLLGSQSLMFPAYL